MRKSNHAAIREYLRERETGATVPVIADDLGKHHASVLRSLKCMPDAYIHDWYRVPGGPAPSAIWRVVRVPPNQPKPKAKKS